MLTRRLPRLGIPHACAEHAEFAVEPAQLRLVLHAAIANRGIELLGGHPGNSDPIGLEIGGPPKSDVSSKLPFKRLRQ